MQLATSDDIDATKSELTIAISNGCRLTTRVVVFEERIGLELFRTAYLGVREEGFVVMLIELHAYERSAEVLFHVFSLTVFLEAGSFSLSTCWEKFWLIIVASIDSFSG